jgi:hypothetical protein
MVLFKIHVMMFLCWTLLRQHRNIITCILNKTIYSLHIPDAQNRRYWYVSGKCESTLTHKHGLILHCCFMSCIWIWSSGCPFPNFFWKGSVMLLCVLSWKVYWHTVPCSYWLDYFQYAFYFNPTSNVLLWALEGWLWTF